MQVMTATLAVLVLALPAVVNAQPENVTIAVDGNETSIAIDPTNHDRLVGGANLAYVVRSSDRGSTWQVQTLESPLGVWGDPALAFDPSGRVYFAHLSNPPAGGWIDRIVVQRSDDRGATWTQGEGTHLVPRKQQDKEWLAVDFTGGRWAGRLHASWTEFDRYASRNPADSSRVLYAHSDDGGETWSAAKRISDRGGNCVDDDSTTEGAVPAVGPNGEVYIGWADARGIVFDKSTDGGATWGADRVIAPQPGGWVYDIPGLMRCNGLPVTGCDISEGPHRGTVYVSWTDQRNGVEDTDVWLIRSTDAGATWSAAERVNGDTTRTHQFMSWMVVDRGTGAVYLLYYDRRRHSDNRTDVVLARSTDGGRSFTERRVSAQAFTANAEVFLGDYVGIDALGGTVATMWTRIDGMATSLVTAVFTDTVDVSGVAPAEVAAPATLACRAVRSRAREPLLGVRVEVPRAQRVRVDVFDLVGRHLGTAADQEFEPGVYTIWWREAEPGSVRLFRVTGSGAVVGAVGEG